LLVGVCTVDRLAAYEWKDKTTSDPVCVTGPPTTTQMHESSQ